MSKQALAGAPPRTPGTHRIVICEEVFDYKVGDMFITAVHPQSGIAVAIPTPDDHEDFMALKKAIWKEFTTRRGNKQIKF